MNSVAPESTSQQDLRTYLRILWRWKLLFLAFVVLIPVGAYLLERGKPKIYESSTLLDASGSSLAVGSSDLSSVSDNPQAVARLVTTDAVASLAARQLNEPLSSAGALLGEVSASADTTTGFLTIVAQDHSPARAAAIATAFADALGGDQAARANQSINAQLRVLDAQLAGTRGSDQVARGATLPADRPAESAAPLERDRPPGDRPRRGVRRPGGSEHAPGDRARLRDRAAPRCRRRAAGREQRPAAARTRGSRAPHRHAAPGHDSSRSLLAGQVPDASQCRGVPDPARGAHLLQRRSSTFQRGDRQSRPGGRQDHGGHRRGDRGGPRRRASDPGRRRPAPAAGRHPARHRHRRRPQRRAERRARS